MKFKTMMAKVVAKLSLAMAKKACGAASSYGSYQPSEPTKLLDLKK